MDSHTVDKDSVRSDGPGPWSGWFNFKLRFETRLISCDDKANIAFKSEIDTLKSCFTLFYLKIITLNENSNWSPFCVTAVVLSLVSMLRKRVLDNGSDWAELVTLPWWNIKRSNIFSIDCLKLIPITTDVEITASTSIGSNKACTLFEGTHSFFDYDLAPE